MLFTSNSYKIDISWRTSSGQGKNLTHLNLDSDDMVKCDLSEVSSV